MFHLTVSVTAYACIKILYMWHNVTYVAEIRHDWTVTLLMFTQRAWIRVSFVASWCAARIRTLATETSHHYATRFVSERYVVNSPLLRSHFRLSVFLSARKLWVYRGFFFIIYLHHLLGLFATFLSSGCRGMKKSSIFDQYLALSL